MNSVLQPVEDLLNNQAQKILLLQTAIDLANSTVVYDHLERDTWLLAPGAAANTGATGSLAKATQGLPGVNSAWLRLEPHGPYADAYWYEKKAVDPTKKHFRYETSFLFGGSGDAAASQAIELDVQQVIAGLVFNSGLQFDFAENQIRVWNRYAKEHGLPNPWQYAGLPCPRWTPNQWISVIYESHRDDKTVFHDAITINGVRTGLKLSFPAVTLNLPDMLNCGMQLDGNQAGTAYQVYRDDVRFIVS